MNKLKIRKTSIIALVIVIVSFIGFKFLGGLKEAPKKDGGKSKIVKVDVINIINKNVKADIAINGRLVSKYKIEVFTEVTGMLLSSSKEFKEGVRFNKNEILLRLDDSNYKMNLYATRSSFQALLTQILAEFKIEYPNSFSKWEQYINGFNPELRIVELPEVPNSKEKSYLVSKNIYTQFYNIKSQEAQLNKYKVIAPFTGVVNNANINPNSVVRAGQKLAEFINPDIFELEVGVSLAEISKITIGDEVTLNSNDITGEWIGKISRISESIDEKTMTFKIYIEVKSNKLYEGMYLKGILNSFEIQDIAKISSHLIVNNNYVYTANDSLLHFQKVEIIHESGDSVLVRGLKDNSKLITHSIANAYEGMKLTLK